MTEEKKFCRICKNLGIDCEAGTFYCSLSHRPDKLPNTLKCDEFILCDSIARLEQENKELQALNKKICEDWEKEIKVYWNALEEIKNDLKEVCKEECDYTKPKFCGDCDCRYGQILIKINEVLNDN